MALAPGTAAPDFELPDQNGEKVRLSDFQGKQTGYVAALKTYSMVQRMTLFDYMTPR